jgi:hypothetical protein
MDVPMTIKRTMERDDAVVLAESISAFYVHHARGRLRAKFARLIGEPAAIRFACR